MRDAKKEKSTKPHRRKKKEKTANRNCP